MKRGSLNREALNRDAEAATGGNGVLANGVRRVIIDHQLETVSPCLFGHTGREVDVLGTQPGKMIE